MAKWFERMAAIPGVRFTGSPGVAREALAEAHVRPQMSYVSLMWPTAEGSTSATPASRHVPVEASGADLVTRVWEALELPGGAMDYHFVLQGAVDRLWSGRRSYPDGLELLEVFALLDLELMEAAPQAVSFDTGPVPASFVHVTSVPRLVMLLEREGAFSDALEVARRLAPFEQGEDAVARLSEKIGALSAEATVGGAA
ncbi:MULTISPECIES: hypothetical protein [unclassified Streptomyces]|uniref:hypothetical protein n=1 Tax=unclassified Streptomyces TaxID=2593676 RepID=UPI000F6FF8BC|nr:MULTISPECIES: hypothetical protein [unclassified Streptomyces]AZM58163.1 hypothetical protein DLM49_00120 [Streptomyces sp. WAC 01438]AZM64289.1 hypothetical protein DLM49_36205 [Streptomyces sp. WAC 01438]RSM99035.1 hypothetical protein DMA10_07915 [Streptomyces sp. WAC 01420]